MVFNKNERNFVLVALSLIIAATVINLNISYRKSRDLQRKADIRSIYDALMEFEADYGYFPLSSAEGKIVACLPEDQEKIELDENGIPIFKECEYLKDGILNYLSTVPTDPKHTEGRGYFYISNGSNFQILASLESNKEDEYSPQIEDRGLPCGNAVCNFGRSNSGDVLLHSDL